AVIRAWVLKIQLTSNGRLPYLNYVSIFLGEDQCNKLTREDRKDCVRNLIESISNIGLQYVTFAIEKRLFNSKKSGLSLYDYLLATSLGDIMIRGNEAKIDGIYAIIEDGCSLPIELVKILGRAASRRRLLPLGHINFLPWNHIPLQVADMIAYDSFKEIDNKNRFPNKSRRRSFQEIIKGNPLNMYLVDDRFLDCDLPKMKQFLNKYGKKK
ncbi:MAG: hypothetical protein CVT49_05590, partial [candidate division Zixibacteria bacterium HGW-Zixibacteria-1]